MSARVEITTPERQALLIRRRASAEAATKGRAHRALPLDEVEARERAKRMPWPAHSCSTASHTALCDCTPAPSPGFDAPEFLADPPRPQPPAYPWRAFAAWFLIVFICLIGAHALGAFQQPQSQVAAR